ncbi:MAG: hypothetical protein QOF76_4280 [Solirubrobacteraceae bacterium]|nr:hypothetical protein [Solirubrobacteraceae bacterium]
MIGVTMWGDRNKRAAVAAAIVAVSLVPGTAHGAVATTIAPAGTLPGLAVDPAGTAYIAYNGPEALGVAPLQFCRLPRGATACDTGVTADLLAPGTSLSRPFVIVTGDRVVIVQYRYGQGVPGFSQLYRFTSTDRGVSFDRGAAVGKIAFTEAVPGPGDTLSGVTDSDACGLCFQNVALSGTPPVDTTGVTQVPFAVLSTDRPYGGAVGLLDAATPLAVFADNAGAQQFRRYGGTGDVNVATNWTAPVDIVGSLTYPKLAGGPTGLFMLGINAQSLVRVRKWGGTTFGQPVTLGSSRFTPEHLFQDAAGRLHAVFSQFSKGGVRLVHAGSADGVTWSRGFPVRQAAADPFDSVRVATAADHIGFAVWRSNEGIRAVRVGPAAAGAPGVTTRKPTVESSTSLTFTATVNPRGLETTVHFLYGTNAASADGSVTFASTDEQPVGSGDVPQAVSVTVTGLVPNAPYRFRAVATNSAGRRRGKVRRAATPADPPPPPPEIGETFNLKPDDGVVLVKNPDEASVPLTESQQIVPGAIIDARDGALVLKSETGDKGKSQKSVFKKGIFSATQSKKRRPKGIVVLRLARKDLKGRSLTKGCNAKRARASRKPKHKHKHKVLNILKSDAKGKFRTRGRYSSATVRGTKWDTIDRCDGTLTKVHRGAVTVMDLHRHKRVIVRAGHSYLAKR